MTAAPPAPPGATPATLAYHTVRLRWCRLALLQWLRRWGVYVAVAAMVVGAGTNSPGQVVVAVAAWLVLPLFWAATHGPWLVAAAALQALLGAAAVWGMRTMLWPQSWAEGERALPLAARQRVGSDAVVVALALTPLLALWAGGALTLLAAHPPWLQATRGRAVLALVLASGGAWVLGVALLQARRRPPRPAGRRSAAPARAGAAGAGGWLRLLLWLPLWRGPARRTGTTGLVGTIVLCGPGLALLRWPGAAPWWLAAWAALALLVVTRTHGLAREEFAPVFDACAALPLRAASLARARSLLCLLPMLAAAVVLGVGLLGLAVRPLVLVAYVAACSGSAAWEVFSQPTDPVARSSRWLFCLALAIALATEVLA